MINLQGWLVKGGVCEKVQPRFRFVLFCFVEDPVGRGSSKELSGVGLRPNYELTDIGIQKKIQETH